MTTGLCVNAEAANNNSEEEIGGIGGMTTQNWFMPGAAMILVITGGAKVWTAFGDVKVLTVADPIFGIQFKHLMLMAGVAELAVAAVCLFAKADRLATVLVAWMATDFLIYRVGLRWMNWQRPCSCLGNLTDALHISPTLADNIMKAVLAYLLVGSYGLLFRQWYYGRRTLRHQENTGVQGVEV